MVARAAALRKTLPMARKDKPSKPAPEPVDVHDGIPDRAARPSRKRLLMLAGAFVVWVGFLVYCLLAGSPQ
jgi:hypothetical protein